MTERHAVRVREAVRLNDSPVLDNGAVEDGEPTPSPSRGEGSLISIIDIRKGVYAPLPSGGAGGGFKYAQQHVVSGEGVASIHEDYPLARCHANAFVHRIIDAAIGLRHPSSDDVLMTGYDVACAIGGASIDNDKLQRLVVLLANAEDRLLQRLCSLIADGDNADEGKGIHEVERLRRSFSATLRKRPYGSSGEVKKLC